MTSLLATPEQAAAACGGSWTVAHPGRVSHPVAPRLLGEGHLDFSGQFSGRIPDAGVLRLPGAHLMGPHGWAQLPDGRVVGACSWYGHRPEEWSSLQVPDWRDLRPVRVRGRVLSVLSEWASENFGHFLLDGLGRLELVDAVGPELASVQGVAVPSFEGVDVSRCLAATGLDQRERLTLEPGEVLVPDELIVTTFPGSRRQYQPWTVDFLRARLDVEAGGHPLVYVERSRGGRRVTNSAEVTALVSDRGFVIVDPMAGDDLFAAVAGADVVVGAHAAALSSLVVATPGTRVLEILPTDHTYGYWFSLASAAGLQYWAMLADSSGRREKGDKGPSAFDVSVDLERLDRALDVVLGR